MLIQTTSTLTNTQKQSLFEIWNAEYPKKLAYQNVLEFEEYLSKLGSLKHFLLCTEAGEIKGWACSFERESERWFAILLANEIQKKGYGKQLLNVLQKEENSLNGWVIDHNQYTKPNGEIYRSPLDFYLKCGFLATDIRLETEKISALKIVWENSKTNQPYD